jgi:hypothetical protein
MRIIEAGHHYELESYDIGNEEWVNDDITFMKRIGSHYPGNTGEAHPGTNCQEVLRVLIDRVKYLDDQIACSENKDILDYLRHALLRFEQRAARIRQKPLAYLADKGMCNIEDLPTCKTCGHIECEIKEHKNDI